MDGPASINLFESIEPHCHLPEQTRTALWLAYERVRNHPEEFAEAVSWLDGEYSEAAVRARKLKQSEQECRMRFWEMRYKADRCETIPRRMALRAANRKIPQRRRLALLQKFYSVPQLNYITSEQIVDLSKHTEKVRPWLEELTIGMVRGSGSWREGDRAKKWGCRVEGGQLVDIPDVKKVWRTQNDQCRKNIQHYKEERRQRDARILENVKDPMGRFLEAVRDSVEGGIPAANPVEYARRLVLLAAIIASPEPISSSSEFGGVAWETEGNIFRTDGPYQPGREVLFQKSELIAGTTQWSVAGFAADNLGKLIARAVNVLLALQAPPKCKPNEAFSWEKAAPFVKDFQTLGDNFDKLAGSAMTMTVDDTMRDYRALASQGGRLARLAGLDRSTLTYPEVQNGAIVGRRIDPIPGANVSVTLAGTKSREDDFLARIWGGLVDNFAHAEPHKFPSETSYWDSDGAGGAQRTIDSATDMRAMYMRCARCSSIAASLIVAKGSFVQAPVPPAPSGDENAFFTSIELSGKFSGVAPENARKALKSWRKRNSGSDGFVENQDARSNAPRFTYRLRDVRPVMERLQRLATQRVIRRKKTSGNLPTRK